MTTHLLVGSWCHLFLTTFFFPWPLWCRCGTYYPPLTTSLHVLSLDSCILCQDIDFVVSFSFSLDEVFLLQYNQVSLSVAAFMSWVLAAVITIDNGTPFLSGSTLRLSPPLFASISWMDWNLSDPPKGAFRDMLSSDCHPHSILWTSSYTSLITWPINNFWNTPLSTQSWNLLWHVVEPEPYSLGSILHWHPVLSTYIPYTVKYFSKWYNWTSSYCFNWLFSREHVLYPIP